MSDIYMNVKISRHGRPPWVDIQEFLGKKTRRIIVHDLEEGKRIADAWAKADYSIPGKIV